MRKTNGIHCTRSQVGPGSREFGVTLFLYFATYTPWCDNGYEIVFVSNSVLGLGWGLFWIFFHFEALQYCECNRNPETRQKLCGAVRWYRAAVVKRLWRRRLNPETRVRSLVATHLLTSLNLPVSSLAPDSNWIPVTLVAEDGLEARAGCRALGRRIV